MEVIVIAAAVFGLVYAFTHRGGDRVTMSDSWQPAAPNTATIARPARAGDVGVGTQRAAAVQLARLEGRQLVQNEAFIVGVVMSIAVVVLFGVIWTSDNLGAQNSWRFAFAMIPVFTLPFAGLTLVAANLGALRSRRDGAEELFGSLPADDSARVAGHVGSVWAALIVQLLFVVATVTCGKYLNHHFGVIDSASLGDAAVSFVLVGCAASLAVALARWLPHPLVSLAALIVLAFGASALGGIGDRHWSLTRQLSIWPRYPDHDLLFAVRPSWWHALYLLGLGTLVALAAVVKSRRDRVVALSAVVAALLAAIGGAIETRPMTNRDAERIAALVADPVAHSTCRHHGGLILCAYRDYAGILEVWTDELAAPFAAVAPQRRAVGFTVVWREPRLDRLDPAVKQRMDIDTLTATWVADDTTWNGVAVNGTDSGRLNRVALGLWSGGLPLTPGVDGRPCAVGGQARGVVALWVAAQGMPTDAARHFVDGSWSGVRNPDAHSNVNVAASWLDGYVWTADSTPPVLWSTPDIDAAQAIVSLEPNRVREVLWSDWPRWIDPATSTDELLTELGLPPAGAPAGAPADTVACP